MLYAADGVVVTQIFGEFSRRINYKNYNLRSTD